MSDPAGNPVYVALLFILRCLIPLLVLFGISYLLRRLGLVQTQDPEPPQDDYYEYGEPYDDEEHAAPETSPGDTSKSNSRGS